MHDIVIADDKHRCAPHDFGACGRNALAREVVSVEGSRTLRAVTRRLLLVLLAPTGTLAAHGLGGVPAVVLVQG